jgi:hypothetical protein
MPVKYGIIVECVIPVDGIKDSVVIESLQKGMIKSEPFLKG